MVLVWNRYFPLHGLHAPRMCSCVWVRDSDTKNVWVRAIYAERICISKNKSVSWCLSTWSRSECACQCELRAAVCACINSRFLRNSTLVCVRFVNMCSYSSVCALVDKNSSVLLVVIFAFQFFSFSIFVRLFLSYRGVAVLYVSHSLLAGQHRLAVQMFKEPPSRAIVTHTNT